MDQPRPLLHTMSARPVAYVTDVEGMWERLRSFVDGNALVSFDDDGRLLVREGAVFVFGGDAVDRGPHSRRIVRTLVEARRRQPDRVVLLAGNRDINKLRLPRELSGHLPRKAPPDLVDKPRGDVLRFLLSVTMNAAGAFEFRRDELRAEGARAEDDDVVDSVLRDLDPMHGAHIEYLRHSQLAFRCGRTLFVHGGVSSQSVGHVPGRAPIDDVDAWIEHLNAFLHAQLDAYCERPVVGGDPPFLPIIQYQAPRSGGRNPESVVYGRFGSDAWNNPRLPDDDAPQWLLARGVHRVVVGHTPCGDVPTLLRVPCGAQRFEIVMADNSRGRVTSGTQLQVEDDAIAWRGTTLLDDDTIVRTARLRVGIGEDTIVGLQTADARLIKGSLDDGRVLTFRFDEGYTIRQHAIAREDLGPLRAPVSVAVDDAKSA